ncbi:YlbF family regulator [Brevibacillus laterosporus]|uniref:YlbF family regulator n=1 Tax=Brevibacillus laterosporus TaxID=1465 RepID=UPI000CE4F60A|nr:YlbF family regulator [Brevibacillus laterosporus]MBG9774378.1 regulator [Brevibacillus laterosporus]PPA84612.1 regulator [Brevibacillus laterosporus]
MIEIPSELDMASLLLEADDLAIMINESREVNDYLQTKQAMENDEAVLLYIQRFNRKRQDYEEVQRFGKYHPDFHKVMAEIRELKQSYEALPAVRNFKKAEARLDQLLYQVGRVIADSVSESVKVPSNNPIMEAMASGCGTGGSCGCDNKEKKHA